MKLNAKIKQRTRSSVKRIILGRKRRKNEEGFFFLSADEENGGNRRRRNGTYLDRHSSRTMNIQKKKLKEKNANFF
jgi:hypothetical protein